MRSRLKIVDALNRTRVLTLFTYILYSRTTLHCLGGLAHYIATTLYCDNTILRQHYIATTLYCDTHYIATHTILRQHYIATTLYCDNTILRHTLYCDNTILRHTLYCDNTILRHTLYCDTHYLTTTVFVARSAIFWSVSPCSSLRASKKVQRVGSVPTFDYVG